jgi:hypothetical protein
VPAVAIADEEADRSDARGQRQLRGQVFFHVVEHMGLPAMGDGQVRDDLGVLPAVRRRFRPSRRDGLGQGAKRLVRRRRQIEHARESLAFVEPDGEGTVPADQHLENVHHFRVHAIDVQERNEHRHVRGNPGRRGGIEAPPPVSDQRLGFFHYRQQSCLACSIAF